MKLTHDRRLELLDQHSRLVRVVMRAGRCEILARHKLQANASTKEIQEAISKLEREMKQWTPIRQTQQ